MGPVDQALVIGDFIQAVQLLICHRDMAALHHLHVKLVNWLDYLIFSHPSTCLRVIIIQNSELQTHCEI